MTTTERYRQALEKIKLHAEDFYKRHPNPFIPIEEDDVYKIASEALASATPNEKITDDDILIAGDEYSKNGKQKHKGVTSFDFLAGARWMEKALSASASKDEESSIDPLEISNWLWDNTPPMVKDCLNQASYRIGACEAVKRINTLLNSNDKYKPKSGKDEPQKGLEPEAIDLNKAVRQYLLMPTHRQNQLRKNIGYLHGWDWNKPELENNKVFFNWVKEIGKQQHLITLLNNDKKEFAEPESGQQTNSESNKAMTEKLIQAYAAGEAAADFDRKHKQRLSLMSHFFKTIFDIDITRKQSTQ